VLFRSCAAKFRTPARDVVTAYVDSVLDGSRPASKWVFAACQRFSRDLERADVYLDWDSVDRLVEHFAELSLVGDDSGRAFELHPWQVWVLANLWGWRYTEDRRRRVKLAILQVARGAGKTTLAAGLCLWDMAQGDGRRVHVLANTEHQAEICLDTAKTMIGRLGADGWKTYFDRIGRPANDCEMSALPALEKSLDGLNPSMWVADEAAEFKGRFLTKLLTTGSKRRESLGLIITTPGSQPDNIYGELVATGEAILRGEVEDDAFMPMLFGLDAEDAIEDEGTWSKANPSMEYGQPDVKSLRRAWNTMRQSPLGRHEFTRYHCARLCEDTGGWLDMALWPGGQTVEWEELRGRPAWIGLDLSKTLDMTAMVAAIPLEDGRVVLRGWYWWPKQDVAQREIDYRLPVRTWAANGHIELTPGREIDYERIRAKLTEVSEHLSVQSVAYDRWGSKYMVEVLAQDGHNVEAYSMGIATFGPGCQLFQQLWASGKIVIADDPIMRTACRTAIAKRDRNGNIAITKEQRRSIVDPLVAAIIAVHAWGGQSGSMYDDW
jgi:phage terminase large subunit-like protein